jgi:hypothetical protein
LQLRSNKKLSSSGWQTNPYYFQRVAERFGPCWKKNSRSG